jgi:hypothetical protein
VRYVLEGSIRREGDLVRIAAQLIDSMTGGHRWADRYDRRLDHIFAIQDEVARNVAAVLAAHVSKRAAELLRTDPDPYKDQKRYLDTEFSDLAHIADGMRKAGLPLP